MEKKYAKENIIHIMWNIAERDTRTYIFIETIIYLMQNRGFDEFQELY